MNSGSAISPELVTFIGIRSSDFFFHADPPDPTTLIHPLNSMHEAKPLSNWVDDFRMIVTIGYLHETNTHLIVCDNCVQKIKKIEPFL